MDTPEFAPEKRIVRRPGYDGNRAKNLDLLVLARQKKIKLAEHYGSNFYANGLPAENEDEDHGADADDNGDDLDDFIEKDGYEDHAFGDDEDSFKEQKRKRVQMMASDLAAAQAKDKQTIFDFMKKTSGANQAKKPAQQQKIDELESKNLMESLFNGDDIETAPTHSTKAEEKKSINQLFYQQRVQQAGAKGGAFKLPVAPPRVEPLPPLSVDSQPKVATTTVETTPRANVYDSQSTSLRRKRPDFDEEKAIQSEKKPLSQRFVKEVEEDSIAIDEVERMLMEAGKSDSRKPAVSQQQTPQRSAVNPPHQAPSSYRAPPPRPAPQQQFSPAGSTTETTGFGAAYEDYPKVSWRSDMIAGPDEFQDADGSVKFYWIDAFEDALFHPGSLYVFGKAYNKKKKEYESVCVTIHNIERRYYVFPKRDPGITLEHVAEDLIYGFEQQYTKNAKKPRYKERKGTESLKYVFGQPSNGSCLEVRQEFRYKPITTGASFESVIGNTYTALELALIDLGVRGPNWMKIPAGCFKSVQDRDRKMSWCRLELQVENLSNVQLIPGEDKVPPLRSATISLKTHKHGGKMSKNDIQINMVTIIFRDDIDCERGNEVDSRSTRIVTIVRDDLLTSMSGDQLTQMAKTLEQRSGGVHQVVRQKSEIGMLSWMVELIGDYDPDIIVGHDITNSIIEEIFRRHKRQPFPLTKFPRFKFQKNFKAFSFGKTRARLLTAGRLICDTYMSARDLVKQSDYTLSVLARDLFEEDRDELEPEEIALSFDHPDSLRRLIQFNVSDAIITNKILFKLQIIPLTRELTCIAGNLWVRSLQNSRAERNEMLLMHEFNARKYIFPDSAVTKDGNFPGEKFSGGQRDEVFADPLEEEVAGSDGEEEEGKRQTGKKKATYAGGLVLEPQRGLYDNYILLLDFQSLYPSIIREYNVCFTTTTEKSVLLDRKTNQGVNKDFLVEFTSEDGILPSVIKNLVEKRRQVKAMMKNEQNEARRQALDIKQKAVKLIANSMYGCLGFSSSRFFAKPLASYITRRGREILGTTFKLVTEKLNFNVIYGDTDSIMINTMQKTVQEALAIGKQIKNEVNKSYKHLEIEIDGILKPLLLLRKKKYAAMKLENLGEVMNTNAAERWVREMKGIDLVRREWCPISKRIGEKILSFILNTKDKDEITNMIYEYATQMGKDLRDTSKVDLLDFIINKQLNKHPKDYADSNQMAHVKIAKRLIEAGETESSLIGHMIPYIFCKTDKGSASQAEKAYHPSEVQKSENHLEVDVDYYISQQILPPLLRLCEPLEGITSARLGACFQLDSKRYHHVYTRTDVKEGFEFARGVGKSLSNTLECHIRCPYCQEQTIYNDLYMKLKHDNAGGDKTINLKCIKCFRPFDPQAVANQLKVEIRKMARECYAPASTSLIPCEALKREEYSPRRQTS